MNSERIQISPQQAQEIEKMLKSQGIAQSKINQIINGEYETYSTEYDIESSFGLSKKYSDILEKLLDGYTIDELQIKGITTQKIQEFQDMLQERNLTAYEAKSIYQYSVGSNMILGIKRGITKDTLRERIMQDLEEALQIRGVPKEDIEKMKQLIQNIDYQETLYSNYDRANEYMEQIKIQPKAQVSVRSAMQSMDRWSHIDETITSLDEGLGKTNLSKSIKVYRAVKSSYLEKVLPEEADLSSLVGKTVSHNEQISTSPLYNSSFAKYDDYDIVFEIYVPEGSRGLYITELSAYDNCEQEILLNPSDLYILNVQKSIIDENGKEKNVFQALALSKDRECYKQIEQPKRKTTNQGNMIRKQDVDFSNNLPAKQSRLLKFLNSIRARLLKKKTQQFHKNTKQEDYLLQTKKEEQEYVKKSWELDLEEKIRIQKETARIEMPQQLMNDIEEKEL